MTLRALAFLTAAVAMLALGAVAHAAGHDAPPRVEIVRETPADLPSVARVQPLTAGPKHHFVGYYGITPWDTSGARLACLETDVVDRLVRATDRASVCLIDPASRVLRRVAETSAWNLQQGAMLHWLSGAGADGKVIYNDRVEGRLVSVVLDVASGDRRVVPHPIAAVAPDGNTAVAIDYDRLRRIRPVTGYAGGPAGTPLVNVPRDGGLSLVDLNSGAARPLVSVEACLRMVPPPDTIKDQPFWLEHALFSRDGRRVFFIARAFDPGSRQLVSLALAISPDGTNMRALLPWAVQGASHFEWLDGRRLVVTREHAPTMWHHLLIDTDDPAAGPTILAPDVLTRDGHCTFSPDGRWMVTDTYPDEQRRQHLFVYDVHTGRAARLASFHTPAEYRGDWRCDLHPRWSRDSRQVCIDSTHDGTRQVYLVHLRIPPAR